MSNLGGTFWSSRSVLAVNTIDLLSQSDMKSVLEFSLDDDLLLTSSGFTEQNLPTGEL